MKRTVPLKHFTLIELLVVISIISILAGMLLPALHNARKMANGIDCAGKLKTLSHGTMQYGNDYDDFILAARNAVTTGHNENNLDGWYGFLEPYVGSAISPYNHTPEKVPMRFCKENNIFNGGKTNLARNRAFGWGAPSYKYRKVRRTSDFIGYADANENIMFNEVGDAPMVTGNYSTMRYMSFPHTKKANASYLDCHVGTETYQDMKSGKINFQGSDVRIFYIKATNTYIYK